VLQGVGAAAFVPASLSLLTSIFVGEERNRAVGVYGGMAALGFVALPVVLFGLLKS
jgi:MFS family permease